MPSARAIVGRSPLSGGKKLAADCLAGVLSMARHPTERGRRLLWPTDSHREELAEMREVVTRSDVPAPSLPFSAGIRANGFVFTSGQVGTDPRTGEIAGPDVGSQTRMALENLRVVLEAG